MASYRPKLDDHVRLLKDPDVENDALLGKEGTVVHVQPSMGEAVVEFHDVEDRVLYGDTPVNFDQLEVIN